MLEFIRPMEVLLNTVWLLVTISAFLLWRPGKYKERRPNRDCKASFAVVALACAMVLLFPVISLTDDLNAEQANMEDSSRTIMKARGRTQACLRAGTTSLMPAVTAVLYASDVLRVLWGSVILVETHVLCRDLISSHEGRAPPHPFLIGSLGLLGT